MNKISIKARLLFLTTIPLMAIFALSVFIINEHLDEKNNLETTKNRILEAESLAKAIHYMQIERGLSVGFVASGAEKNKDKLPEIRQKVDSTVEEIKTVFAKTDGDISVLENLSELNQKRAAIDSLSMSAPDVGVYFSKTIVATIDTTTVIPSIMDIKAERNAVQAYTHLASAKEQLGQIRANLNGAFTKNIFAGNTYFSFGGNIGAYKVNLRKFTTLAPDEIRKFHENKFKGEAVDKTMSMIDVAQTKGTAGDFGIEPSVWFSNVTASIELLREVELELFKHVIALNEEELKSANNTILLVSASLVFILLFILFLISIS
jgi:methyl-accepting chemotaxis protein